MKFLQEITLYLFVCLGAVFLGATVYQMMVVVPAFGHDLPHSLIAFNQSDVKTALFWTSPLMPAGFIIGLLAAVLHWRTPRRYWVLAAVLLSVGAEIFTIVYFSPRLRMMGFVMQGGTQSTDSAQLARAAQEWVRADVLRFWVLVVPAFLCSLRAVSLPRQRS